MFLRRLFAVSAPLSMAAAALIVIAVCSTRVAALVAQSSERTSLSPADRWDTFSADITIRRHLLASDGATSADAPTVRYRWTRSERAGGWKSIVEISGLAAPTIRSSSRPWSKDAAASPAVLLDAPTSVVRIEDDEDGTPVRVFDRQGRPMRLPSVEDRRVLGEPVAGSLQVPALPELAYPEARRTADTGREWVDAFIAVPSRKDARRDALHRRFGRAMDRVRELDRFVTAEGTHTMEVLTDRTTAVPMEINVAQDGVLVAQSTLTYGSGTDGALVRRAVRTEQTLSTTSVSTKSTQRAVANVELANVRLERRGRR
jgi:hypothetical protein